MLCVENIVEHILTCSNPWILAVNALAWLAVAWACDSELRVNLVIQQYFRDESRFKLRQFENANREARERDGKQIRRIVKTVAVGCVLIVMIIEACAWYHSKAGLYDGVFFLSLTAQLALAINRIFIWSNPDTRLSPAGSSNDMIGTLHTDQQGRPTFGWRDSPAVQSAVFHVLSSGLSAKLVFRNQANDHGVWGTLALIAVVVGAAGATDRKKSYKMRKTGMQIFWAVMGIAGLIFSVLARGWWVGVEIKPSLAMRPDAEERFLQADIGPAAFLSGIQWMVIGACVDVIIPQLATLLRFDQVRYGLEENSMPHNKLFSFDDPTPGLEEVDPPELRLRCIPGYFESPRFAKPTYRAGLAGAFLGSTCAMLICPQRQATVFWVYLGAVGYVIFVAASLTLQGRWDEFWKYEETYIPEGTKIPHEAQEAEEQEKLTNPVGTGSAA